MPAAENPVSSSTSPVNVGASIGFNATADDPENNSYYLIVCDSNSVTAGAGGGTPTCGGVKFCSSALTGDTAQASCIYSNVSDPGAETKSWFAFVCDNHATEAMCSLANQGTGDSGSPMWINHAPTFSVVTTTIDNRDPGATFTIQGSVADTDSQGGVDTLTMSICSTNSWATSTGCAATTLCAASSTGPTISCNYTTAIPTAHGPQNYYAFVKDWHNLGAAANSLAGTYTTNNVAPTISNITFNNGSNINLNIKNAGPKTVIATSTSVTDNNGCVDIVGATSTVYMSTVAGTYGCAANDNNCYKILTANCTISACAGGVDTTATVSCTTGLAFHAIPTDVAGDNPYASSNWVSAIVPYDETLNGVATSTGVEVIASAALDVTEPAIPYGILRAGQNSGLFNATTTVVNFGNTPLNSDITGTQMTKAPDMIPETNQNFGLFNFNYGAGTYYLSSTTARTLQVVPSRPTSQTDVTGPVYWGIAVPALLPSGDYSGVNTFIAALRAAGGTWN
ncbi:MAG: hypothetical protein WCK11_04855 [Candidatus Falkowbacteria bacterium]